MPIPGEPALFRPLEVDIDSYVLVSKNILTFYIGAVLKISTSPAAAIPCCDRKLLHKIRDFYPDFCENNIVNPCFSLSGNAFNSGISVVFEAIENYEDIR